MKLTAQALTVFTVLLQSWHTTSQFLSEANPRTQSLTIRSPQAEQGEYTGPTCKYAVEWLPTGQSSYYRTRLRLREGFVTSPSTCRGLGELLVDSCKRVGHVPVGRRDENGKRIQMFQLKDEICEGDFNWFGCKGWDRASDDSPLDHLESPDPEPARAFLCMFNLLNCFVGEDGAPAPVPNKCVSLTSWRRWMAVILRKSMS